MMSRRKSEHIRNENGTGIAVWISRILLFASVILLCLVASSLLYLRWQDGRPGTNNSPARYSASLNPLEELYLQLYLASNKEALNLPLNFSQQPVKFVIEPGENADIIAANLVADGIISKANLFTNYVRFYGLDSHLEAGTFSIDPTITISELANLLTDARAEEVEIRLLEGWRIEEVVHYLRQVQPANIDPAEFRMIVARQIAFDLEEFDYLASLPTTASLEGFLFPDTYRLPIDADAEYLVQLMLENFGQQVSPSLRQAFGFHGLTVHEAVTLASIVQREAIISEERAVMVGVFMNRLQQDMMLQADPTVQYALGYQQASGQWWKSQLTTEDLDIDSPYNTYRYKGLPPAPISSPGLATLEAVGKPVSSDYLFFVVDCNSDVVGDHIFSRTFEEHVTHAESCR